MRHSSRFSSVCVNCGALIASSIWVDSALCSWCELEVNEGSGLGRIV